MTGALRSLGRLLAVTRADLQALSRSRSRGLERSLFLGVLLLAVAVQWPSTASTSVREMSVFGAQLFRVFFVTAYIATGFLVPSLFSGAFVREKRDENGLLLFSTPFRSHELVLGRFLSYGSRVLLVLACGVPVFFSTLLFGGVAGDQMIMAVAAILGLAFFVGAFTFFLSALAGKGYVAGSGAIGFLLFEIVIVALVSVIVEEVGGVDASWKVSRALMPHVGLITQGLGLTPSPGGFWFLFGESLLLGVLFLGATTLLLRPLLLASTHRGRGPAKPKKAPAPPAAGKAVRGLPPSPPPEASAYRGPVWPNPVAWKDVKARKRTRPWVWWTMIVLVALLLILLPLSLYLTNADLPMVNVIVVVLEVLVLGLVGMNRATATLVTEREEGRLDLLSMTPVTAWQVWWGKGLGVLRGLLPFLALVAIHFLVWGVASFLPGGEARIQEANWGYPGWHGNPVFRLYPLMACLLILFATLGVTLAWGLLVSLLSKRTGSASVIGGIGVLAWWIGVPVLFTILDWHEFLDETNSFNPLPTVAEWARMQGDGPWLRVDPREATLWYLFFCAVAIALFTGLFFAFFNRALGRSRRGRARPGSSRIP
ncbi:MAG: hypothetical protein ACYS47_00195 [Planctomycetota bacterium]|jgi:hypothetical protein